MTPDDPDSPSQPGPISTAAQTAQQVSAPLQTGPISAGRGASGSWDDGPLSAQAQASSNSVPYKGPLGALIPDSVASYFKNSDLNFSTFKPFGQDVSVDPSATVPRQGVSATGGGSNPGPVQGFGMGNRSGENTQIGETNADSLRPGPISGAITRNGNSYSGTGGPISAAVDGMSDAQRNNAPFHQAYLDMQNQSNVDAATQATNRQTDLQRQLAAGAVTEARSDRDKANWEAEVARFTGGNGQRALNARTVAAQDAYDKATAANIAQSPIDYLNQLAKGQGIIQSAAQARREQAQGQQTIQKGSLELQQQQRVNNLGQQIATSTNPQERAQLQQSLLTLLGKNETGRYDVKVVPGGTRFDANNATIPIKDPDKVVVYDKYGQEPPHEIPLGQQQAQQASGYGHHPEGSTLADKAGKIWKVINGQLVPQ